MGIKNNYWPIMVSVFAEIIKQKGLSQEYLSERSGYKQSTISRILNLKYEPGLEVFLTLCYAAEVNIFIADRNDKTDFGEMFELSMEQLGRRPEKLPKN